MPRRALDFYETPPHYIAALLGEVNIYGTVFEPCVGDGAIARAIHDLRTVRRIYTNDIDRKRKADTHDDARTIEGIVADWWVTNPPFDGELEILENALSQCGNIAFLGRLSFLEPTEERSMLLETRPPTRVIVLPRYSFRLNDDGKKQTDNVTCCWMVWGSGCQPGVSAWGRGKSQGYAAMRDLL